MEGKLLENLNEGYNEATEDLIKNKLTESFKKKDKLRGKISKLQAEKAAMELLYKDNELLGKYMSIIEQIASLNIQDKELDGEIYENMEASGTELLEGKNCDITIKHPYTAPIDFRKTAEDDIVTAFYKNNEVKLIYSGNKKIFESRLIK